MTQLEMLQSPEEWPRWPFLPLIRTNGNGPKAGVLVAEAAIGPHPDPIVRLGNLFTLDGENYLNWPKIEYPSLEAITQEWRID